MNKDPLEDEIVWTGRSEGVGVELFIQGSLGAFCKRRYGRDSLRAEAKREIASSLLKAVYEGREREKREADKQFVGAV